jgi:hypothetical protein
MAEPLSEEFGARIWSSQALVRMLQSVTTEVVVTTVGAVTVTLIYIII